MAVFQNHPSQVMAPAPPRTILRRLITYCPRLSPQYNSCVGSFQRYRFCGTQVPVVVRILLVPLFPRSADITRAVAVCAALSRAFLHLSFRALTARTIEHENLRKGFEATDKLHRLLAMAQRRDGSLVCS
jgi:hypothetical protein